MTGKRYRTVGVVGVGLFASTLVALLGFPSNRGGLLIDDMRSFAGWRLGTIGSPPRALRPLDNLGLHAARASSAALSARICS